MSAFATPREIELQYKVTALEAELLAVRYANKTPMSTDADKLRRLREAIDAAIANQEGGV